MRPVNYKGWAPKNYDRNYRGPITLRDALALSLNTIAVKLNMEVGPKAVVQAAQRLGISSPLQANGSLALGTSEVTPLELVSAYAAFANGGIGVIPYVIAQVKTTDGKLIYKRPNAGGLGRVIDPGVVAMMNEMMHNTFVIGTAQKAQIPGWALAGKTGTTDDYKDAWFVGFTGNLVAGVWLGNDDGALTKRVTGGNLPTEVWHNFMKIALKDKQPVRAPRQRALPHPVGPGGRRRWTGSALCQRRRERLDPAAAGAAAARQPREELLREAVRALRPALSVIRTVIPGPRKRSPESITTTECGNIRLATAAPHSVPLVVMDSGLDLWSPRNDSGVIEDPQTITRHVIANAPCSRHARFIDQEGACHDRLCHRPSARRRSRRGYRRLSQAHR